MLKAQESGDLAGLLSRNGLMMEVLARYFCTEDVVGMETSLTAWRSVGMCAKVGGKMDGGETKESFKKEDSLTKQVLAAGPPLCLAPAASF